MIAWIVESTPLGSGGRLLSTYGRDCDACPGDMPSIAIRSDAV